MTTIAPKTILIVEDEPDVARLATIYLEKEGFRTVYAKTGEEGFQLTRSERPDMILLDLMSPEMDGLELCKKIRSLRETASLPVILLTTKTEEPDTIIGLALGADDYVTKPFTPKSLAARVNALFRRLDRTTGAPHTAYSFGPLVLDRSRHEVINDGQEITLTAKEFGLLEHLLQNPGRILTRDVLLNAVWGYDYFGTTRTVDVHIRRLKQKLPLLNEAIVGVKSLGYKLIEPLPRH